ncbi:hypothetical protein TNCV_2527501 [Trichonephila clavipes]|nr:hypothetical protein TNCV_2527501 [Trichonephila clavipes]
MHRDPQAQGALVRRPLKRASDSCSPYQGFLDRADSNFLSPSGNGNDSDMANLSNDMELELTLSQRYTQHYKNSIATAPAYTM